MFHLFDFFFLFVLVDLLERFVGLVVQDDQVSVADVETGQMVARVFGVEDVFVDDERRPSGFGRVSHPDLPYGSVLAEYVVHFFGRDFVREVPDVQDAIHFGWQSNVCFPLHRHLQVVVVVVVS